MKKALSLLLVLIMVLSLVACGTSNSTTQQSAGTAQQSAGTAQQSSTTASAPAATSPNAGRTVNLVTGVLLTNVDPHFITQLEGQYQIYQVYEGLVKYDERTGEAYPRVAESWEYGPDNAYLDFKINPEVTFHNGEKVTAEDVVWSYDRILEQKKMANKLSHFSSWEAIDESTFRINLDGTTTIPLMYVSELLIGDKSNFEEGGDDAYQKAEYSVGTGPFMYTKVELDGTSTAEAYENYYRGKANVDGVTWTYLTDKSTALIAFQAGDFDCVILPAANVPEIEAAGQYNVLRLPATHNHFIGINYEKVPNKLVRQAILYAIDNEAIMNAAVGGLGIVSHNLAEAGMVGGGYSFDDYYNYNPEKSHELLLEAGYTEDEIKAGIPIGNIVSLNINPYAIDSAMVQEMLRQVGLIGEVLTYEQANVEELWYRRGEGSADMALVCHGDNIKIDTGNFFDSYIATRAEGTANWEKWGLDGKVQELGVAASSEFDQAKRNEKWQEFWEELKDQAIYYSLFHRDNLYVATKDLNVVWGVNYFDIYDWSWTE